MLKENQLCKVKWHHENRQHYESLGYIFTSYQDYIMVKPEELTQYSHSEVVVICDYCGKEIVKGNHTYKRQHDKDFGDACKECKSLKQRDIFIRDYGVSNISEVKEIQDKRKATIMQRYGCENPSQIAGVQEKKMATCMKNYGVAIPLQSKQIREKAQRTMTINGNVPTSSQQLKLHEMLKKRIWVMYFESTMWFLFVRLCN